MTAITPEVAVAVEALGVCRADLFPPSGPVPWLDRPDAWTMVGRRERVGGLTAWEARVCEKWIRDGYVISEQALEHELLDDVWSAYEAAIEDGVVRPPNEPHYPGDNVPGRVLDPHLSVPAIADLMCHPHLTDVVELLLGAAALPFQSISGHKASQQAIHGDSIHMTTYPPGYLVALWIAFQDVDPGAGPLEFYPGSHRLPTVYSNAAGISQNAMRESGYREFDDKYTPAIRRIIAERRLRPRLFHARKGDVLFWHANLLHGGSRRTDFAAPRRALVFHYFAHGCICYHDLSGTLSRVHLAPRV